jgi:hypothetical protein
MHTRSKSRKGVECSEATEKKTEEEPLWTFSTVLTCFYVFWLGFCYIVYSTLIPSDAYWVLLFCTSAVCIPAWVTLWLFRVM